ncbi:zinc transporter ZIP13 homolog [Anthonomus grandis grandis]|uniref:zinc transporter ZIP13 homolog n=1 Tax=Anthonomus grandis grandis TaxID=2921223 RepID=UPI002166986E|nr:zinc transporter ZIP13 homolog [Anthonomus grandis grandis]
MVSDIVLCVSDLNRTGNEIFQPNSYLEVNMPEMPEWVDGLQDMPWLWAMFGSILVGLSGVLPLLVIPMDQTDNLKQGASANKLKSLLSFAVGGLLGDVFLHSLPEIWANNVSKCGGRQNSGLLILTGLITFVAAEKLFGLLEVDAEDTPVQKVENNNVKGLKNVPENNKKHISGYLNLVANTIDNFTHGLSLGGAFLVSPRLGVLTTFAILVHEIPHEVGDFAILLKSGFTRWHAAIFQILTAGGGLVGALSAIVFSGASNSIEARTSWILPFTAGTFLHIGLVTVLPDLLKEEDPKESCKQLLALLAGIFLMALVTNFLE